MKIFIYFVLLFYQIVNNPFLARNIYTALSWFKVAAKIDLKKMYVCSYSIGHPHLTRHHFNNTSQANKLKTATLLKLYNLSYMFEVEWP